MFTRDDIFKQSDIQNPFPKLGSGNEHSVFIFNDRYSLYEFYGIMPDSRAAGISLASEPQVLVL